MSLSQQAYGHLRDMVRSGMISADEPLSERTLAEQIGLGRTPVREALKQLERNGLIEVIPGRGTFVKRLTLSEMRELYEVRMGVEGISACIAAQRGGTPALAAFRPVFVSHLDSKPGDFDVAEIQDAGVQFHKELVVATGNQRLMRLHLDLNDQIALSMRLTREHDHERVRKTVAEHLKILDFVLAGDPEAAQGALYEHLSNALAARVRIFSFLDRSRLPAAAL